MARIAFLVGPDFEDSEFSVPRTRFEEAGHAITVLGVRAGVAARGKQGRVYARIEHAAADARPEAFDVLVIPGGHAPAHLRLDPGSVSFVRRMADAGRIVAAVCHGPLLLADAGVVRGRTLTSWPQIRKVLEHAGAHWMDQPVVRDGRLITSRRPADLEAFVGAVLDALEGASRENRADEPRAVERPEATKAARGDRG